MMLVRSRTTTKSSGPRAAVIAAALIGIGQREVVAGHVWESAEIDDVAEAVSAGLKRFVAAGGDGERIAGVDRIRHRQEQREPGNVRACRVRLHLNRKAG